ncbi:DUF3298 and DUF4163 domain-containing protein [Konateibacter massiliensis]|uniref:DUF3298 and DUF4163 domain-containing protein n=1 Tax=Konateibacter massiliensis TaxID=2002841 RepID=UPI000C147346|nr:DUF3298 and DUF4163 domain-containing protein [Konateibacter massiliensis]
MKKKAAVAIGVACCVMLGACQDIQTVKVKTTSVEKNAEAPNTEAAKEEETNAKVVYDKSGIKIVMRDKSREVRDKNDNLILTITGNLPVVTIENNSQAAEKINAYLEENQKKLEAEAKEYIAYATDNFTLLNKNQLSYWNGYAIGDTYSIARVDEKVISVIKERYEYAGGAHPNTIRTAQNFDTQTGELLTLETAFTDVNAGTQFINSYLLKKMKETEDTVGFFEDYESSIKDILTDNTWYLSDEGIVIISNVYIVSPYAAGIQEYTIPYDEFPYLKEQYRKN